MQAELLTADAKPEWTRLWAAAGEPLWAAWDYMDAVAPPAHRMRIGFRTKGGELVAACHFTRRRYRGVWMWGHPIPAPATGVLTRPEALTEALLRDVADALSKVLSVEVSFAQLILPEFAPDARPFLWSNPHWSARPHYNYVSRIDKPDALEAAAEGSVRRQIRKAREMGLEWAEGADLLPRMITLFHRTRERQRFAALLSDEALAALGGLTDLTQIVGIVRGDELLAGAIIGTDRQRIYYLVGANSVGEGEGTGAPSLLHAELTRRMFEARGAFLYDWVGANTASVAQFKKKFRPDLEIGVRLAWRSWWARLLFRD